MTAVVLAVKNRHGGQEPLTQWLYRWFPILDNPIAVREWRVLFRRASDWRIWVGARWPLDPIVWGAPVVLTYALAPFALYGVLLFIRRLRLLPSGPLPLDAFFGLALVFWAYVVAVSLVLGATAVTREREQKTWEPILVTSLTARQRAIGFLWGRLGPVWVSLLLTFAVWWLSYPGYGRLLGSLMLSGLTRAPLAAGTLTTLALSVLAGEMGLLASTRATRSTTAVVVASIAFLAAVTALSVIGPIPFVSWIFGYAEARIGYLGSLGTVLVLGLVTLVYLGTWRALVSDSARY